MDTLAVEKGNHRLISYHKLSEQLIGQRSFSPGRIIRFEPAIRVMTTKDSAYVDPNFTVIHEDANGVGVKIILISAAGATGKSALTERLSQDLGIPIFDLAQFRSVGQDSLTGMLTRTLGPQGYTDFMNDLKAGRSALIIDALDEGKIKTSEEGYNVFLDDIIEISREAQGVTFILLGRGQVIDHTWLYIDDKGLKSSLLQIAPFNLRQAESFIDLHITRGRPDKYTGAYVQVRNYIIQSIEAFFTNSNKLLGQEY